MHRRIGKLGSAGRARDEGMAPYQRSGREDSDQNSFISEISPEEGKPTGFWHAQSLQGKAYQEIQPKMEMEKQEEDQATKATGESIEPSVRTPRYEHPR